jgi:hypothetical protein
MRRNGPHAHSPPEASRVIATDAKPRYTLRVLVTFWFAGWAGDVSRVSPYVCDLKRFRSTYATTQMPLCLAEGDARTKESVPPESIVDRISAVATNEDARDRASTLPSRARALFTHDA